MACFFHSHRPTCWCDAFFSAVIVMILVPPPTEAGVKCPGVMGTPGYLPLECLISDNVTCHASQDVFAVAVLLLLVCVKSPMMRSNMFCHEVRLLCTRTCSALFYVFAKGNEFLSFLCPWWASKSSIFVHLRVQLLRRPVRGYRGKKHFPKLSPMVSSGSAGGTPG